MHRKHPECQKRPYQERQKHQERQKRPVAQSHFPSEMSLSNMDPQLTIMATRVIEELKEAGMLKALPIIRVNEQRKTLYSNTDREFKEYGLSGTWISTGELQDGSIRYLGSASHAGHIELKALYVMVQGRWYSIVSGESELHRRDCFF